MGLEDAIYILKEQLYIIALTVPEILWHHLGNQRYPAQDHRCLLAGLGLGMRGTFPPGQWMNSRHK